jgi:hypothetical protein
MEYTVLGLSTSWEEIFSGLFFRAWACMGEENKMAKGKGGTPVTPDQYCSWDRLP